MPAVKVITLSDGLYEAFTVGGEYPQRVRSVGLPIRARSSAVLNALAWSRLAAYCPALTLSSGEASHLSGYPIRFTIRSSLVYAFALVASLIQVSRASRARNS